MSISLKNKHILITGGAGGIGQTIASKAHEAGATITLWDIQENGSQDKVVTVDTTDEQAVSSGFDALPSFPDVIINCAGIFSHLKPFTALEISEFNELLHTNTTGCFLVCREALRRYQEQLTIINLSSALSTKTIPLAAAYSASKAGIDSITRSIAAEFGDKNVLAISLNPGPVQGTMLDRGIAEISEFVGAPAEAVEQQIREVIPSGMLIEPSEIAALALVIAADKLPSMQGKQIHIDGGFTV